MASPAEEEAAAARARGEPYDGAMDADRWNERYSATDLMWSAGPNQFVERWCADLAPGRAIDLAAGEGRNALWLAERGWDVTAVDYSSVAVDRMRQIAERRGVELTAEVADLTEYVPTPGGYDLVMIAYLHLGDTDLVPILGRAGAAVAPGGQFFLVGHDRRNLDEGWGGPSRLEVLTSPDQVVAALPDELTIERAEVVERRVDTADGEKIALDTLVIAHR